MTQSYIQSFANGFAAALQLPAPDARIAAKMSLGLFGSFESFEFMN